MELPHFPFHRFFYKCRATQYYQQNIESIEFFTTSNSPKNRIYFKGQSLYEEALCYRPNYTEKDNNNRRLGVQGLRQNDLKRMRKNKQLTVAPLTPAGDGYKLLLRYLVLRQGSEGGKSRPLDHMRQIPFVVTTKFHLLGLKLRISHIYI